MTDVEVEKAGIAACKYVSSGMKVGLALALL